MKISGESVAAILTSEFYSSLVDHYIQSILTRVKGKLP